MAVYKNHTQGADIVSVEFVPSAKRTLAFLRLRDTDALKVLKPWLVAQPAMQVVGETLHEGAPTLIANVGQGQEALLQRFIERGDTLREKAPERPIDPWVVRSVLGIGGQSLQLASSFLRPKEGPWYKRIDTSIFVFAASNLAANFINLAYRAQAVDDVHQLQFLKQRVNEWLGPQLAQGGHLFTPTDNRSESRPDQPKKHMASGFHGFMQRNSVNVGELGLRYLGAFGLAFPTKEWTKNIAHGNYMPAFNPIKLKTASGLVSIAGKTVALGSKIPDPYNPETQGWFDKFRSSYSFVLGGVIETGAFAMLAYHCFAETGPGKKHPGQGIRIGGKDYKDWLGGFGASMFVVGYLTRLFAKYGERHVNMHELYAHTADTLAMLPPEKMPQALADTAARLAEHFKGQPKHDFATIYSGLANDLEHYHQVPAKHPTGPLVADEAPGTQVGTIMTDARISTEKNAIKTPSLTIG